MFCRFIAAAVILLSATLPASALYKPIDEALTTAASRMKVKDFRGAHEAALRSTEKGPRAFLIGMSAVKLELWDEAAPQLAVAAESYPILADYALYYEGVALSKQGRADQALAPLYKVLQQYPESRLVRPTMILYGDTLAASNHFKEALETYTVFIERYPSGSDSISALFGSALCRAKLGDPNAAASGLRGIWLTYPTSPFAEKAATELQRMTAAGTRVDTYSSAELFKRACTLYDLGRFKQAADALAQLPLAGATGDFAAKVQLKLGEAQFRARHYRDAQATLRGLAQNGGSGATEANFWLAKAMDKTGQGDDAFDLYLRLADPSKGGSLADDALLEAAYLKRYQRKWGEAEQLFKRYLAQFPNQKSSNVLWETAWSCYQAKDLQGAASYFRKLTERDETREKGLYWLGKTLAALGDAKGADTCYGMLATEYPFGYYALLCKRWSDISQFPTPPRALAESIPMPGGYEREKALISLGLYDEAARELSGKRTKNPLGVARLYLEMGNYNGAFHSITKEKPKKGDSVSVWGITYPLAYREDVAKNASANAVPESLVYAIMRTESNYAPAALSPVGAVGLMQIMPATAEVISKGDGGKLTRPELNIKLGSRHLRDLLSSFNQNIQLVAAAYNAGSGNVRKWQKGLGSLPQDEFVESIPFRETREYVKKVVTAMELYQRLYRLPGYKN